MIAYFTKIDALPSGRMPTSVANGRYVLCRLNAPASSSPAVNILEREIFLSPLLLCGGLLAPLVSDLYLQILEPDLFGGHGR